MRMFFFLAVVIVSGLATGVGNAQSWTATGTGPFTWETGSNWSGGSFPNGNNADAAFSAAANADSFLVNINSAISIQSLTFNANQTGVVTLGGTGSLTLQSNGNVVALTVVSGSGNHVINTPVIVGGSNNSTSRVWLIGANQTLTVNGNISQTANRSITKSGAGVLVLTGNNTFADGLNVTGGTVYVNNTTGSGTGSGPVFVSSGSMLGGTGTVGGNLLVSGAAGSTAKIAPGTAPAVGNLTVAQRVTLSSDSELIVRLNGATGGNYDRLTAGGGFTIAGTTLTGSVGGGYTPTVGDKLFVMVNSGVASTIGTFNGLPEGATVNLSGFDFFIHYGANFEAAGQPLVGGNDVALTPVPEPATCLGLAAVGGLALRSLRRRVRG